VDAHCSRADRRRLERMHGIITFATLGGGSVFSPSIVCLSVCLFICEEHNG